MLVILGFVISVPLLAFYVYNRLTRGICKSSKHLVGKVAIVTGGNAGIGYETAKNFAERGARVILACRSEQRGITARDKITSETGNEDVHFRKLDLSSFESVRAFAENINQNEKRLDILVNNAGMYMGEKIEMSEDGLLLGMHTNHFGPFLLTNLLLGKLKATEFSRIVTVSSDGHRFGKIEWDNLNMEKDPSAYSSFVVYANSKLCNILMTTELARQLQGSGVTANAFCPGLVQTDIIGDIHQWWYKLILPLLRLVMMQTPWEGAQTAVYLAVSPEVNNISGEYFTNCSLTKSSKLSRDANVARKMWELSEKVCKLK